MSHPQPNASLEIVATFEGSVLDVRHLRPRSSRAAARFLGIVGGALLLVAVAWPWLGLGFVGLVILVVAGVKASEPDPSRYSIGEGTDVALATPPVDLLTPERFELAGVGHTGAGWIQFTAEMAGEITMGGRRYSLQEWVARGWAVAEHGVFGTALPVGARCRIEHGDLIFHIAEVPAAVVSVGRAEVDVPFWGSTAAAFVGLGTLLVLAQLAAPDSNHLELDDATSDNRFVGYFRRPDVEAKPRIKPMEAPRVAEPKQVPSAKSKVIAPVVPALSELPSEHEAPPVSSSPITRPRGASDRGRVAPPTIHGTSMGRAAALMTRGRSPLDEADSAGALAFVDTSVFDNEHSRAFSPGADDREWWAEQLDARKPLERSVAGLDLIGKGRGGGPGSTDDMVTSTLEQPEGEDETQHLVVKVGTGSVRGPRARDAVRGVVRRNAGELRPCWDAGGKAQQGRVTLEFEIDADGDVVRASVARGRSTDPTVTDCIAREARSWSFPRIDAQRHSLASIPLSLRPG